MTLARWAVAALILGALVVWLPAPAPASTNGPAESAREAADALVAATAAMRAAVGAQDQVAALAGAIRAFEGGLELLRVELRAASLREATLQRRFEAQSADLARLLGVLGAIGRMQADAGQLAHPAGPLGTARAGMLLGEVAPALAAQAAALERDLREAGALRAVRAEAQALLLDGLDMAQAARSALGQAMAERSALPSRLADDPEALARFAEAAQTLDQFAQTLADRSATPGDTALRDFALARGSLPLPVRGVLLRRAGEADAAGIARPGLMLATVPGAIVTAPWTATVRYAGPLRGYGNVIILEPAADYLLVLAGLEMVYVRSGEVLTETAPLGTMGGGSDTGTDTVASGARTQSLYVELRERGQPVDPAPWFALTAQDG